MLQHFPTCLTASLTSLTSFLKTPFLGNPVSQYLFAAAILLATFFFRKAFARLIQTLIRLFHWKDKSAARQLSAAVMPSVQLLIFAAGFSAATSPMLLTMNDTIASLMEKTSSTLFVVVICLLLAGIATALTEISHDVAVRHEKKVSMAIYQFYRQAIRASAIILALFMILKVWGFDISSLLTGIGIGGLAISLAAQETFANLIGGITIMADRAFEIGDTISTPDIDGNVEAIGFRSSRIRTFTQAVVTVPNAKLSNSFITNYSRMGKRRIRFTIPVDTGTSVEQLDRLTGRLREIAAERKESILEEGLLVFVERLNSSSLDVLFQCFVNMVEYDRYLAEQQAILLAVLQILKEMGIEIACPTPQMFMNQKEERK